MGACYKLICNRCGYEVMTSGPWEFYRDEEGRRKPFGNPVPISKGAAERGIYGLSGKLYCPNCR